jgi:hypothetical protein
MAAGRRIVDGGVTQSTNEVRPIDRCRWDAAGQIIVG